MPVAANVRGVQRMQIRSLFFSQMRRSPALRLLSGVTMLLDCNDASAGEILWNYGEGYDDIREHAGYAAGEPCAEGLVVPVQTARVEAILAKGGLLLFSVNSGGAL